MRPEGKLRMKGMKTIGSTMISTRCAIDCICVDMSHVDVS
jgi:hypothetical protein